MPSLSKLGPPELEQLIKENIQRDALMALDDAYKSGDDKCVAHATLFARTHRSSGAGQNRHFFTNETFHEALTVHGAKPSPLCGTKLVIGKLGIFSIARLNVPGHKWVNLKGSKTRKQLAQLNTAIERTYVQGDLFDADRPVSAGTIFILGVMDGLDIATGVAKLTQVMIALPAPDMKSWLYIKPLTEFLKLYDLPENNNQYDGAVPTLKAQPKKLTGNDQGY
ncbi:hypothetical protein [Comamonas sp. GB3 AK4-5]|uniref:hypothetical protein n=1 Tax=Comamonas sp. GB3 AK4-5 TaxID=3231487 RepID=UPI00351E5B4E